jgi:hypothetical protein
MPDQRGRCARRGALRAWCLGPIPAPEAKSSPGGLFVIGDLSGRSFRRRGRFVGFFGGLGFWLFGLGLFGF